MKRRGSTSGEAAQLRRIQASHRHRCEGRPERGDDMDVVILALVVVAIGLAAAALGGVFALYASRQD